MRKSAQGRKFENRLNTRILCHRSKIIRTIQVIVHVPEGAFADWVDEIANFIDTEVSNERAWGDNEVVNVDSVAIVYGDDQFRFPFAHSGDEFRWFIKHLEQFNRL